MKNSIANNIANRQAYYCEAYRYDEYERESIHRQIVSKIEDYLCELETWTRDWDEVEIRTAPCLVGQLLGEEESKFLGKVINPRSQHIVMGKGWA